ncbi:unnamed protein product [Calypogeia fissa]
MGTLTAAMMQQQSWILVLVCLLLVGPSVAAVTSPVETSALLAFKASLEDPDGNLGSWTSGTDPCAVPWQGIFCVQTDYPSFLVGSNYTHVTELRLLNLNLGGQLVSELGNLIALKYLDVMWNSMTGTVPPSIGSLSNLALLLLNGNQFSGSLPEELGNLTNMQRIQVDQNYFSGQVPRSFNKLVSIRHLHMNNNSFTGTLPEGLGGLEYLVHVLLDNNNLTGTLPEDLANAPSLLIIQLDNNQFNSSATIPPAYGGISTLLKLSLRNCGLQGPIPNFTNAQSLSVLDLSFNNFTGSIPSSPYPVNMTGIDVSHNGLTGSVPPSFSNLQQLQFLAMRDNQLQGEIPATLGTAASFTSNSSSPVILDFQDTSLYLANGSNLAKLQGQGDVQVWFAGDPLVCGGPNPAVSNPLCVPTNVDGFLGGNYGPNTPANSQCSACNSPYVLVPSTDSNQCRCAAPITVKYRLKSPSIVVFDLYEEAFQIYIASGLNLSEAQVEIQDYQYEPGPRIAITILLFPTGPTFDDATLNALYSDFANWKIPDSSVFGPYELLQFIPPGTTGGGGPSGLSGGAIGGIIAGSVVVAGVLAALLMFFVLKKRGWDPKAAGKRVLRKTGLRTMIKVAGVRTFTFEEMVKATDNFSDKNILGQGGYGKVYFGTLEDGQKVAVKRAEEGSLQGATEFETEIHLLSRVHHRNLVSLVGYCNDEGEHTQGEQMLVYEYISNGTLRAHLKTTKMSLDVVTRLRIALGSARGIHYLHTQADPPIFHRDIKASNILLDEKYNAKVADFGLSKLAPTDVDFEGCNAGHISTMVKGTPGYLDPEYFLTHKLTDKSDVYSFGVVLLELVTGMPPISEGKNIIREVSASYNAGHLTQIVDPRMGSYPIDTVEPLCKLALACCHSDPDSRPSMAEVLHELEEIWKETPWSDVASHSYVGDLGEHPDFPSQTMRGFSSMSFTDASTDVHSTSDLLSHTNINVLPR